MNKKKDIYENTIVTKQPNEDYVWVKQYKDDKGQTYYTAISTCFDEYTTKLNKADTTPLNFPYLSCYKLIKVTYELIDNPNEIFGDITKGIKCKDEDCSTKELIIKGKIFKVD